MASKRQQAREVRKSSKKMGSAPSKDTEQAVEEAQEAMPEEFEVKSVLDYSDKDKKYKVRWKGCTEADDTWEPVENLANAGIKLHHFWVEKYRRAEAGRQQSDISDSQGAAAAAPTAAAGRTPRTSGGVKKPKYSTKRPSRTPTKRT
jgi:hypothetical protein